MAYDNIRKGDIIRLREKLFKVTNITSDNVQLVPVMARHGGREYIVVGLPRWHGRAVIRRQAAFITSSGLEDSD